MVPATAEPPDGRDNSGWDTEPDRASSEHREGVADLAAELETRVPALQQFLLTTPKLDKRVLQKDNRKLADLVRRLEDDAIPAAKAARSSASAARLEEVRNSAESAAIALVMLISKDSPDNRQLLLRYLREFKSAASIAARDLTGPD